ncbi:hypothetical protein PIB30_010190 [Stylosanthes scabra]|uniref:Protein FAR1-RELATED SEQUENCE n=1 Tax=Stylosanthes scabra TaxID=79078 RepID=A0ABU6R6F7_9FABA|nr:hypothetical protein [Stylosanthes scabra]
MESFGIPCVHIVGVLVSLDIDVIPEKLILNWWTKKAKQSRNVDTAQEGEIPYSAYMSMHAAMLDDYRELVKLCCRNFGDYFEVKKKIATKRDLLRAKEHGREHGNTSDGAEHAEIRDPKRARHKGCGKRVLTSRGNFCRVQRCRRCERSDHNARKCDRVSRGGQACTHGSQTCPNTMEAEMNASY